MSIEIDIQPRLDVLQSLSVSRAAFDAALEQTLGSLHERGELPIPEDMPIILAGREHRLGDIADIEVSTDGDIDISDRPTA
jgi:hypothetical protein